MTMFHRHFSNVARLVYKHWPGVNITSQCNLPVKRFYFKFSNILPDDKERNMPFWGHGKSKFIPDDPKEQREMLANLSSVDTMKLQVMQLQYDEMDAVGTHMPEMTSANWLYCVYNVQASKMPLYYEKVSRQQHREKHRRSFKQMKRERWLDDEFTDERREARFKQLKIPMVPVKHYEMPKNQGYFYDGSLIHAWTHGCPLVLDMGWENVMTDREIKILAHQMIIAYSDNKYHKDPFRFELCNYSKENSKLRRSIYGSMQKDIDTWLIPTSEKSALDLYPHHRLVYLSPDSPNTLHSYNANDVYVMAAMLDRTNRGHHTRIFAQEKGIRSAKLPLRSHLDMCSSTDLTLDVVMKIMLTMKDTGDWAEALQHVPTRHQRDGDGSVRRSRERRMERYSQPQMTGL